MIGTAGEDVGQPSLRIDIVHFCGDDQRIHDRSPLSAAIRSGEQPRFACLGYASESSLGCIVRQTASPVIEESYSSGVNRLSER